MMRKGYSNLSVFVALAFTFSLLGIVKAYTVYAEQATQSEKKRIIQQGQLSAADQRSALMAEQARAFRMADPRSSNRMMAKTPCENGMAAEYPCLNVDLLSYMPLSELGGGSGNDIWGWTDPDTGKEYAIMGRSNGTSFVDISDPENPVLLGNLPTHSSNSNWRDVKVYANHAFVVSEANNHGMQVFDMTQLRTATPGSTFVNTAHFDNFGNAHNIVINEDSGYAYAVGANTCSGGLHMINIEDPVNPVDAGCFSSDGYTHDAQCVNYRGPDNTYVGREICLNSNEDTLTIVDVEDKSNPVQLSRKGYTGMGYTHQGWLTEDHRYFLLGDEVDEMNNGHNTRTYIWDVSDLDAPIYIGYSLSPLPAIDHNLYIKGNYVYQSNYRAGLRILDLSDIVNGNLSEVAYFDIYPSDDDGEFNGNWSNYPYFESGVVILSGIEQGLYVVKPWDTFPPPEPTSTPEPTPELGACTTYASNDTPLEMPNGLETLNSSIIVPNSGRIADINLLIDMPHEWVGDLAFSVTHQETGTTVSLIDQPGLPSTQFGCNGQNINVVLDDSASSFVEDSCLNSSPSLNGALKPDNRLAVFNGEERSGTWVLTVTDRYSAEDQGSLDSWGIEICAAANTSTPTSTMTPVANTSTPTPTSTATPTSNPTLTPTSTMTPATNTSTPTPTSTATPTSNPTLTPTPTFITVLATNTPMPTSTPTSMPTPLTPDGADVLAVTVGAVDITTRPLPIFLLITTVGFILVAIWRRA